ncbi:zinc ABC transporter substrate-binding protein [Streptomyces sp. JJ66]|uniref:metal ABC transporter substrate-binding protein n=1 Tax=Streptomyces sp. JJ66 TaxID=2803843 RepID=UPI001C57FBFB|nr:metal ABC transporter substrate-binding protein [Streptomyces sp. JJ66]MBW1601018.1 zinc ABC transporter substrate-binding protein [Streptomyces sp. JJ66]
MNARRRPLIAGPALAGASVLSLLTLSACGSGSAGTTEDGKLSVLASFYPMEFLAERVGGEHVSVTTLTQPGVDPHDLELTPRQTAELTEAGAVLYLKGMQPAVDDAIKQSGAEHVVEASALAEAAAGGGAEPQGGRTDHGPDEENHGDAGHDDHGHGEHGHGEEHGDHGHGEEHGDHGHGEEHGEHGHGEEHGEGEPTGDEPASDEPTEEDAHEGHDHEHDHDHDHGGKDPHIWLDPVQYAAVAEGVGEALAKADPDHAADYRKNADELSAELEQLDTEFEQGLSNTATDTFITTHAAFGHLAARYGLHQEPITGLSPETEPSGARLKELHTIAEEDNVSTVFFETIASDRTAKALAADLNLDTDVLDPLEGITDASRGDDYFAVMRANLEALQKALGAK